MSLTTTLMDMAINLVQNLGYWGIFIGMTLNMTGVELPSEIILPLAGFVAYGGKLSLWGITLVAATAETLGALIIYFISLKAGRPLLEKYGKYIMITPSKLDRSDAWFAKYGEATVLFGRCIFAVRKLVSIPAGLARMDVKKFTLYTFLGSLPYAFAFTYLGYVLGPSYTIIEEYISKYDTFIYLAIALIIVYIAYKILTLKDENDKSQTQN